MLQPGESIRLSDRISIRREHDDLYTVTTYAGSYGNGWRVGPEFPTERGARFVADAIELALNDTGRVNE